jgi:hypothetical protein
MKTYNTNEWLQVMRYTEKFKLIPKKNKIKLVVGYSLISIGLITLPFPTGSPFLILSGLGLLGVKKNDLIIKYEDWKFRK